MHTVTLRLHVILYLLISSAHAQITTIPSGTAPVFDGVMSAGEWSDADSIVINSTGGNQCTVLYKHDCVNLHFAFYGNLESAFLFPEILFDMNNARSSAWESDDRWFHVSATDCNSQGVYGDFTNCMLTQPDWTGIPNIINGAPVTDTIEIQIPMSTIGMQQEDTIGLSLLVSNTFNTWSMWPSGADRMNPSTWATAVLEGCTTGLNEQGTGDVRIYPNPVGDVLTIETTQKKSGTAELTDLSGRLVRTIPLSENATKLNMSALPQGVYFLGLTNQGGVTRKEMVVVQR